MRAATICSRSGDLSRAGRHLADAERIAGMWRGGPWTAAVWEARGRRCGRDGDRAQADALLREEADEYARAGRKPDADRCRAGTAVTEYW